jgi:hypothetical protein
MQNFSTNIGFYVVLSDAIWHQSFQKWPKCKKVKISNLDFSQNILVQVGVFKSPFMSLTGYLPMYEYFSLCRLPFVAPKHRVPTDQTSHNWYRWKGLGM